MRSKSQGFGRRTFCRRAHIALPASLLALLALPLAAAASRQERPVPPASAAERPGDVDEGHVTRIGADPGEDLGFVPGEVIVGYRPGARQPARARARDAASTGIAAAIEVPRAQLLEIDAGRGPKRVARELERHPAVEYAQPNFYRRATMTPDDPEVDVQWGIDNTGQVARGEAGIVGADISALEAWEIATGSVDVTVAVVDTGVDATHPDLAANVAANGYDFVDDDADPSDPNGHGTHVAGTLAAVSNNATGIAGVAPEVELIPVRVLGENGIGTDADIAAGFEHAVDNGAEIVNASFSAVGAAPVIDAAIESAPDTLFVVAAGNGGTDRVGDDNDALPTFPCSSPEPNVICVAATDQSDQLAPFSNYGAESVDLAAPGVDVMSTVPAGVVREFFFEGFERPFDGEWGPGGDTDEWGRVNLPRSSGGWSLSDSPDGGYALDAMTWIDSPPFNLQTASGCEIGFWVKLDLAPGDLLVVDGSTNGVNWNPLAPTVWTGTWPAGPAGHTAAAIEGAAQAQISFRLVSDTVDAGDGVHIDDVSVTCEGSDPGYDFASGTSMATSHVAGAAALVLADRPDASVEEIGRAVLDGADRVAGLTGEVVTGGRVNALRALLPQARVTGGPNGPTSDSTPTFSFASSTADWLECRIGGAGPAAFEPCDPDSGYTPGSPLADGDYSFAVRGVNERGKGPIARRQFSVDTVGPSTRLLKAPRRRWRKRRAPFRFRANEAPVTFECRLDKHPWRACKPPRRYRVKPGVHRFRARATDEAGNRGRPARWRFRVLR